jgi:hypothetical protein
VSSLAAFGGKAKQKKCFSIDNCVLSLAVVHKASKKQLGQKTTAPLLACS